MEKNKFKIITLKLDSLTFNKLEQLCRKEYRTKTSIFKEFLDKRFGGSNGL